MKTTSKLLILVLACLALAASAHAQSPREQLQQMVEQLQKNPADNALRERIIKLGAAIKPAPAIPEEARRAFVRGNATMSEAKTPEEYARAVQLYTEALSIAPWWGDPYFNLAKARELRQEYDRAILGLRFFLLTGISGNDARQAQDQIYVLEEKLDRKKEAENAGASAAKRFVGTWSRSVMGGDRTFHRIWFTLSIDGTSLTMSGMMAEGGKPPYDLVVRGGELEFKVAYTLRQLDGHLFERAVGVVVFTLSADGRGMTSRQTFLPYTPSQQAHWKNWPQGPGDAFGPEPWTKD